MYDEETESLVVLGKDNATTAEFAKGDAYDGGCLPGIG